MVAFASVSDLEGRWRKLSATEKVRAEALLCDAATLLSVELKRAGRPVDSPNDELTSSLKIVSCSMVRRVISSGADFPDGDFTQASRTAGPFNAQVTLANPSGDMYLTSNERRLLGIPKHLQRIGTVTLRSKFDRTSGGEEDAG